MLDAEGLVPRLRELYPTLQDLKESMGAILRGTVSVDRHRLGSWTAPVIATYTSYMIEKRISKHPEDFRKGSD